MPASQTSLARAVPCRLGSGLPSLRMPGVLADKYVTPVADDLVGVAILGGAHGDFAARLAAFPALRSRWPAPSPAARSAARARCGRTCPPVRGPRPARG